MAIEAVYLQLLHKAIKLCRQGAGERRLSALALAYPDMMVPQAALVAAFGAELMAEIPVRADAEAIWAWHGLKTSTPLYDSMALFDRLGIDVTVIDVAVLRGMERIVDLNEPLPADLCRRFDLVIDTGTCEHCFNVGMAFRNACEALAVGGYLVHAAPLTRINHGFWNFSPTVYPDYFEANGFRLHYLGGVNGNLAQGFRPFAVDAFARSDMPANAALYVLAERIAVQPPVWPVQRKYRGMISNDAG